MKEKPVIKNPTDNNQIVWWANIDENYSILVFRTGQNKGTTHLYEGFLDQDKVELRSKNVTLSYDARFGPDINDVEQWKTWAINIIDNEFTISKNTLDTIDSSMKNLAEGKVSDPVDLTEYKEIIEE